MCFRKPKARTHFITNYHKPQVSTPSTKNFDTTLPIVLRLRLWHRIKMAKQRAISLFIKVKATTKVGLAGRELKIMANTAFSMVNVSTPTAKTAEYRGTLCDFPNSTCHT